MYNHIPITALRPTAGPQNSDQRLKLQSAKSGCAKQTKPKARAGAMTKHNKPSIVQQHLEKYQPRAPATATAARVQERTLLPTPPRSQTTRLNNHVPAKKPAHSEDYFLRAWGASVPTDLSWSILGTGGSTAVCEALPQDSPVAYPPPQKQADVAAKSADSPVHISAHDSTSGPECNECYVSVTQLYPALNGPLFPTAAADKNLPIFSQTVVAPDSFNKDVQPLSLSASLLSGLDSSITIGLPSPTDSGCDAFITHLRDLDASNDSSGLYMPNHTPPCNQKSLNTTTRLLPTGGSISTGNKPPPKTCSYKKEQFRQTQAGAISQRQASPKILENKSVQVALFSPLVSHTRDKRSAKSFEELTISQKSTWGSSSRDLVADRQKKIVERQDRASQAGTSHKNIIDTSISLRSSGEDPSMNWKKSVGLKDASTSFSSPCSDNTHKKSLNDSVTQKKREEKQQTRGSQSKRRATDSGTSNSSLFLSKFGKKPNSSSSSIFYGPTPTSVSSATSKLSKSISANFSQSTTVPRPSNSRLISGSELGLSNNPPQQKGQEQKNSRLAVKSTSSSAPEAESQSTPVLAAAPTAGRTMLTPEFRAACGLVPTTGTSHAALSRPSISITFSDSSDGADPEQRQPVSLPRSSTESLLPAQALKLRAGGSASKTTSLAYMRPALPSAGAARKSSENILSSKTSRTQPKPDSVGNHLIPRKIQKNAPFAQSSLELRPRTSQSARDKAMQSSSALSNRSKQITAGNSINRPLGQVNRLDCREATISRSTTQSASAEISFASKSNRTKIHAEPRAISQTTLKEKQAAGQLPIISAPRPGSNAASAAQSRAVLDSRKSGSRAVLNSRKSGQSQNVSADEIRAILEDMRTMESFDTKKSVSHGVLTPKSNMQNNGSILQTQFNSTEDTRTTELEFSDKYSSDFSITIDSTKRSSESIISQNIQTPCMRYIRVDSPDDSSDSLESLKLSISQHALTSSIRNSASKRRSVVGSIQPDEVIVEESDLHSQNPATPHDVTAKKSSVSNVPAPLSFQVLYQAQDAHTVQSSTVQLQPLQQSIETRYSEKNAQPTQFADSPEKKSPENFSSPPSNKEKLISKSNASLQHPKIPKKQTITQKITITPQIEIKQAERDNSPQNKPRQQPNRTACSNKPPTTTSEIPTDLSAFFADFNAKNKSLHHIADRAADAVSNMNNGLVKAQVEMISLRSQCSKAAEAVDEMKLAAAVERRTEQRTSDDSGLESIKLAIEYLKYVQESHAHCVKVKPNKPKYSAPCRSQLEENAQVFAGQNDDGQLGIYNNEDDGGIPCTSQFKSVSFNHLQSPSGGIKIVKVACGGMHAVALSECGKLISWGASDFIGRMTSENYKPDFVNVESNIEFMEIVGGECYSAAIDSLGRVWSWGSFRDTVGKEHFSATTNRQQIPCLLDAHLAFKVVQIACGESHLVVLYECGVIFGWGINSHGQLGRPWTEANRNDCLSGVPIIPPAGFNVEEIFACGFSTFVSGYFDANGASEKTLLACGGNGYGELGFGDEANQCWLKEISQLKGRRITQVSGGLHHVCVLDAEGIVWVAGRGDSGQLGLGKEVEHTNIFKQLDLDGISAISCSVSGNQSYAIGRDGKLYSMGYNCYGQLGLKHDDSVVLNPNLVPLKSRRALFTAAGSQFCIVGLTNRSE